MREKVALVTGGAGAGIGSAISRRLASDGAAVVVADIDEHNGNRLVKELVDAGRAAAFVRCDVSDSASQVAAVQFAVDQFGGLDVLSCHGIAAWHRGYVS